MGSGTGGERLARARRRTTHAALIASVFAAALAFWQKAQEPAPVARTSPAAQRAPEAARPRSSELPRKQFVDGVRILDQRGAVLFTGRVELQDTLQRILAGERYPHRNDGAVFQNRPSPGKREPELPERPSGYYHEYVHPTPGVSGPGPQRVVRGRQGEWYYTPDHYESFIRLDCRRMPFVFDDHPALTPDARVARIPAGLSSARALLEALYTQLALPGYFGFNWNALSDCLRDLSWIAEPSVVLCHADLPPLPEAELRCYLEVLAEAVQSWQPGESHSLHVVFPGSEQARTAALLTARDQ